MEVRCKVIVLGRTGAGKTSLLTYLRKRIFGYESQTLGVEQFHYRFTVGSKTVDANIWDTCGQERFRAIGKMYYQGAHGALLVFDLNDTESFTALARYHEDFIQHNKADTPCVLLGNKADMPERAVTQQEITAFVQSRGLQYYETSAKTGQNVEAAFLPILQAVTADDSPIVASATLRVAPVQGHKEPQKCKC